MVHPERFELPTTWLQINRDRILNVCFSRKRPFRSWEFEEIKGPLSARSGHSSGTENSAQTGVIDQRDDAQGRVTACTTKMDRIRSALLKQTGPERPSGVRGPQR
jgi:hypothetical protein